MTPAYSLKCGRHSSAWQRNRAKAEKRNKRKGLKINREAAKKLFAASLFVYTCLTCLSASACKIKAFRRTILSKATLCHGTDGVNPLDMHKLPAHFKHGTES